ncbi:MAG: tetratricopeptide repeat protein, partial [Rhodospirillales bacterium]
MTADQGQDDLLIRADAAMKAADWTAAAGYLRQLQTTGAGAAIDNALGICLAQGGDPVSAVRAFAIASHKAPDNVEFRFNLATAQKASGDLAAARATFRALLAAAPEHLLAWFNLGNTCLQLGLPDAAADAYEQAFRLRPDWAELCRNRAIALREAGRYEEALVSARAAFTDNPGDMALVRVIAISLDRLGRSDEAADTLTASPEGTDLDLFAELSLNAGRTGQATAALEQGYRSTGNSVWAVRKLLAHPPIVSGTDELSDLRSRFPVDMEVIRTAGGDIPDPLAAGLGPAFYPGYRGEDERERQIALSGLYRSLCPCLNHV